MFKQPTLIVQRSILLVVYYSCLYSIVLERIEIVECTCYLDGTDGTPLPLYMDPSTNLVSCRPGFLCPGLDPTNASTYPVACQPDTECALSKTLGDVCKSRQGLFEPSVCPAGHFCPAGAEEPTPCPKDTLCVVGSPTPQSCPSLTICDGSDRFRAFPSLIAASLCIVLVVLVVALHRRLFWRVAIDQSELDGEVADKNNLVSQQQLQSRKELKGGGLDQSSNSPLQEKEVNDISSLQGSLTSSQTSLTTGLGTGTLSALVKGFTRSRGDSPPLCFDFEKLSVSIPGETALDSKTGSAEQPRQQPQQKRKVLLKHSSGSLEPGGVTAIMGPSGSGKTTLMNTLLGRNDPALFQTEGDIFVNGDLKKEEGLPRHSIGFVPQDDVLHQDLTVYKNIKYSSDFRTPTNWTPQQKKSFLSAVVSCLGLTKHLNTEIGSEHKRGVSGGQRKRVSIAVELVAAPLAMFLDEPTSGLDSTSSLELVAVLKTIARETDLTVAMVIHQPRVEIWNALDRILLLAKGGRTVFQGLQKDVQTYFEESCGMKGRFKSQANPADVIMDAIVEDGDRLADLWEQAHPDIQARRTASLSNIHHPLVPEGEGHGVPKSITALTILTHPTIASSVPEDQEGEEGVVSSSNESRPSPALKSPMGADRDFVGNDQVREFTREEDSEGEPETERKEEEGTNHHQKEGASTNPLAVAQPAELKEKLKDEEGVHDDHAPVSPTDSQTRRSWDLASLRSGKIGSLQAPQRPGFFRQVILSHNRWLEKQIIGYQSFITESFVLLLCSSVLSYAWTLFEYRGLWVQPYQYVSPNPSTALYPQMHMYACMSLSLGAAPAGYGVFGYQKETYFREAGAGHNRLAFFIGTVLATTYRIVITTLIFTSFYHFMAAFTFSFGAFYLAYLLLLWGVYCCSMAISMFINPKYGLLTSQVIVLLFSILNGFIDFPNWLKYISIAYHFSQVQQTLLYKTTDLVFEPQYEEWGYRDIGFEQPLLLMCSISLIFLVVAAIGLLHVDKNRQR